MTHDKSGSASPRFQPGDRVRGKYGVDRGRLAIAEQPQHRLFSIPATLACTGRRVLLHLSDRAPLALVRDAIHSLRALTDAG